MIAYITVQPTSNPDTFRISLTNHTDTLRIVELYSQNSIPETPGWTATFKLYNQTLKFVSVDHSESSDDNPKESESQTSC